MAITNIDTDSDSLIMSLPGPAGQETTSHWQVCPSLVNEGLFSSPKESYLAGNVSYGAEEVSLDLLAEGLYSLA